MENYKLPEWITLEQLQEQVMAEYEASYDFVQSKRELFRSRDNLYMNISNQDEQVYVRLVFSTIQTLKALMSANEISVKFNGRRLGSVEQARNWQNLAKFDFGEMDLFKKKEAGRDNLFKYGVMIEGWDGWQKTKRHPKTIVIDPRSWIPDIFADVNNGFSYHWFDIILNKNDLVPKKGYFNIESTYTDKQIEEIKEYARGEVTYDQRADIISMSDVRQLWYVYTPSPDVLWTYSIYRHYTILNGRKYCTEWANDRTELIRIYEIKAVTKAEKEDPSLVKRPIVVRNWIEQPWDPFGICVPDLLEDKQRMMQLFLNLNVIKAKYEAYGDVFFYDPDVVKNIDLLKIPPTGWPRYIKADLQRGNPMVEAPKAGIKADAANMPATMQQQGMLDMGIDERTMGVSSGSVISATENQRVQNNSNLRMLLGIRLYNQWEKEFYETLYMRPYMQYFKLTDEKNIIINTGLGKKPITVKKKDIGTGEDIDVEIISKLEQDEEDRKKLQNILPIANFVLSRPWSKYGKDAILRDIFQWSGASEEEAMTWVDPSREELQALEDIELLNMNEDPKPCEDLNEDHRTYIVIYQNALNTPAKNKAINNRIQLYIQSWQAQKATEAMSWLGNNDNLSNTQQQLTASSLNKQGDVSKAAQSLQWMWV